MTDVDLGTGDVAPGHVTLAIDVGGSRLKCGLLDSAGGMLGERVRCPTPKPAPPAAVLQALSGIVAQMGPFDRISVGFPGVVRAGRVLTAPNLGNKEWHGFPLAGVLAERFGKQVRLLNDASVQGLGVITGHGLECVVTLGTGFGFALYQDGRLAPHLELGQHPAHKKMTYDEYVGLAGLKEVGPKRWNKRLRRALEQVETLVTYDTLYIGGGNAKLIDFDLPTGVQVVSNDAGITGGVRLWAPQLDDAFEASPELLARPDAPV